MPLHCPLSLNCEGLRYQRLHYLSHDGHRESGCPGLVKSSRPLEMIICDLLRPTDLTGMHVKCLLYLAAGVSERVSDDSWVIVCPTCS